MRRGETALFVFGDENIMASSNALPISDYLVGKRFNLRLDGENILQLPGLGQVSQSMNTTLSARTPLVEIS